jgi:peptidoglycan/LPS O-acetylase OafA/YrhL
LGWREFATPLSWPLGHTWTLAIEEQYYLIWPAIIYVLNRRFLWALAGVFEHLAEAGPVFACPTVRFSAIECILRYYTVFRAIVFIEELSTPGRGILNGQTEHSLGCTGAARATRA